MTSSHPRNFSPYQALRDAAGQPIMRFPEGGDHATWRRETLPRVLATLGRLPDPVPANPELLAEVIHADVVMQRWVIDVSPELSAIAHVNRPIGSTGALPTILCWSGHSPYGKDAMMGVDTAAGAVEHVALTGSNYGLRLAQAGFQTCAIDWMGQGDLDDRRKPNNRDFVARDDPCNIYYLGATLLGMTSLGMNLTHGQRLLDFVTEQGLADPQRIGVIGDSCGGTLALWTTLLDDRIKATELVCYSDSFADFALRDLNYCGSQITPGLFTLVDVADLQGLIAPRPLLSDIGVFDECFLLPSAGACQKRVESIYDAAGASDQFTAQRFDHGHGWLSWGSVDFFTRHLAR